MKSRLLVLTLLTLILTGCLGSSPGTGTAEVGIFVTETALNSALNLSAQNTESVEKIWVTVSKVTARVDGRWVTLLQVPEGDGRINLRICGSGKDCWAQATSQLESIQKYVLSLRKTKLGAHCTTT